MGQLTSPRAGNKEDFRDAVKIYCEHANSLNKEILHSNVMLSARMDASATHLGLTRGKLREKDVEDLMTAMASLPTCEISDMNGCHVVIRELVPKKSAYTDNNFYEVCYYDAEANRLRLSSAFDRCANVDKDPYVIVKFDNISVCYDGSNLTVDYDDATSQKGVNWLRSIFLPKFAKLMSPRKMNNNNLCFTSQVDVVNYYKLYEKLKIKYANRLIEEWTENTDPQKFVFEDIAIATYLLLLWNGGQMPDEASPKQTFVDMGCGNGLLVYLLNSEGHYGTGLDVRKRKIWDTYPHYVTLKEETVVPGSAYPDADWLIGNHSDELTAWIPIMARRSGPRCRYFTIPCCPYHLNGRAYQRRNSGTSTYRDFIQYVRGISELSGFDTAVDRLRIPSTKRICLVGRPREDRPYSVDRIDTFLDSVSDVKMRDSSESVRNCTKLPGDVVAGILRAVRDRLLEGAGTGGSGWNRGGSIPIGRLASLLPPDDLRYMKKECKGLQTLLKNHRYVFDVADGRVAFRSPEDMEEMSRRIAADRDRFKWKQKTCWFHVNHPDGCPLDAEICSYKHDP